MDGSRPPGRGSPPSLGCTDLVWGARTLLPGDGGHEPLLGISIAPTAVEALPSVALAAIASLSFGAVLGPEGPLIALGSIVGMIAVRWWKVTGPGAQVLSTAGAFAAVSALFGGPVVAGALLLEAGIGFGSALIPVLLPGAVAAAVGFTIMTGIGAWGGVPTGPMQIPDLPAYPTVRIVDMALAIVVGVVVALLIAAARSVARRVSDSRPRLGTGPTLVIGGLVVGLLAQSIVALGGTYDLVLFSGQLALPALLTRVHLATRRHAGLEHGTRRRPRSCNGLARGACSRHPGRGSSPETSAARCPGTAAPDRKPRLNPPGDGPR